MHNSMKDLHWTPFERQYTLTDKKRPKHYAERIQVCPMIFHRRFKTTRLFWGKVTQSFLDPSLLDILQIVGLDYQR